MITQSPNYQKKEIKLYDSDSSSYLSQCSDDQNYDYEMAITLKQKCAKLQKDFVMKKSIEKDFSTSEFSFQTEAEAHSLQVKKLENSYNSNVKSADSDPSNDNIHLRNKNQLHQDTLDLNQMLKILDQCEKDEKKSKKSNKTNQSFQKVKKIDEKLNSFRPKENNYQPIYKQPHKQISQYQSNDIPSKRITCINQQLFQFKQRQAKMSHKFNSFHQTFYSRQTKPSQPYYQSPKKRIHINQKRAEQFASSNYLFWGVLISVKLAAFMSVSKNVLVVPFQNTQFSDPVSKIVQIKIKYNLKEITIKQAKKCNQKLVPNGKVFSVKAKGLQNNYRGIYFVKSPQNTKQSLKYYDVSQLKKSIEKIFNLLDRHNEEHVVFPEFQWGSLSQSELCELLISGIFREINENRKSHKCQYLKEVIICVSNCEIFELFSKYLRCYVKQMLG